MKRSLFALGLAVMASSSFAYNAQVDGGFSYFDHYSDWIDSNGQFGLQGTFYFEPSVYKAPSISSQWIQKIVL